MSQISENSARILAVGAHPDDIEFACGGILLAEAARGSEVFLCVCSRGESGTSGTPDEREAEARRAAEMLGATLQFLDFGDSQMAASNENALVLARQIRAVKPAVLLSSVTSLDQHPDHAVVGQLCHEAARFARFGGIAELRDCPSHAIAHHFEYAVTPKAEPSRDRLSVRVDISAHFARWIELMECHRSQLRTRNYVELQTARARLLGQEAGVDHAQALFLRDDLLVQTLAEVPASIRLF